MLTILAYFDYDMLTDFDDMLRSCRIVKLRNYPSTILEFDPISHIHITHHSDNPSTVLVTPLLIGDNYDSWSLAVTMELHTKKQTWFC